MKTVKYAEFNRVFRDVQKEVRRLTGGLADIYRLEFQPVSIVISWKAMNKATPEEALHFANTLKQTAEIVRNFPYNGYSVAWW